MIIDLHLFTMRALIALFLGTLIGIERQFRQCTTGLRTNALVSLGAALFVLSCGFDSGILTHQGRVIGQIVSGIGFVGAGVIMKDGAKVRGLSTAATLWCSSAIGVLCGVGEADAATVGTLLILCANIVLKNISGSINRFISRRTLSTAPATLANEAPEEPAVVGELFYQVILRCRKREEPLIRKSVLNMLGNVPLMLRSLHTEKDLEDANFVRLSAMLVTYSPKPSQLESISNQLEQFVGNISIEKGVASASWHTQNNDNENEEEI